MILLVVDPGKGQKAQYITIRKVVEQEWRRKYYEMKEKQGKGGIKLENRIKAYSGSDMSV